MVEVYFVLLSVPNMADFICWQTQGKIRFHFTEVTS